MWLVILLLAISGFQGLSILISRNQLKHFDESIIQVIQGWENPVLTKIAELISRIGSSSVTIPLIIVVAIVLFVLLKHRKELILLIGGMLGSTLLNELLKRLYHRARPDIHRIVQEQGFSFPSGHSMAAFTLYAILTFILWRHIPKRGGRIALIVFGLSMILCIGLSRIYLGVHYPSDVLGGYWVSACWVTICIRLFRLRAHR
jgi:undecaprenyl-diphosphatase